MASLRQRLLASLLPPLLVVGAVAAGGTYVFMDRRLATAFDQDLGDIARAIVPYLRSNAGRLELEVNTQADAILRMDSADQVYYAVFDSSGAMVAGDHALPMPQIADGDIHFWDDLRDGQHIRAVAIRAAVDQSPVIVMAAETTRKRDRASRDAMVSAIAPLESKTA